MKQPPEPEEELEGKLKKRVRAQRRKPKTHQIVHESGRALKAIWRKTIEKSKELKAKEEEKETDE
jgi:hypothetical protein